MTESMPGDERERYNTAFHYAVVEKDVQFATADAFADWWTTVGHSAHGDDMAAGFARWVQAPPYGQASLP